ncbi:hypothetical protein ACWF9O_35210, partial [Streptomyces sp. NPDC055085]
LELLEELAALAAEKTAAGGLRLMGEGGILPELAQHLIQAALEAEMDLAPAEQKRIEQQNLHLGQSRRRDPTYSSPLRRHPKYGYAAHA